MVRDEFLGAAGASGGGGGSASFFTFNLTASQTIPNFSATTYAGLGLWNDTTGFSTTAWYQIVPNASPGTPSLGITPPTFNKSRTAIAFSYNITPYVFAYKISASGFGLKYTDPATLPSGPISSGNANAIPATKFSPSGQVVVFVGGSSIFNTYKWNDTTGFGQKLSNPSILPPNASDISFTPDGSAIATTSQSSPYVYAYSWNDTTGFGAKINNPTVLPGNIAVSLDFHPEGNAIALGNSEGSAYRWSASGFGAKYSTISNFGGNVIRFSPTGGAIATNNGPKVYRWTYASGFGTQYSNPAGMPVTTTVSFTPNGSAIAFGSFSAYLDAYRWSDSTGYGSAYTRFQYSAPATMFVGGLRNVEFG